MRTDMTKLIVAFRSFANSPEYGANIYEQCRRESRKPVQISWTRLCCIRFCLSRQYQFLLIVQITLLNETQVPLQM
jgi:hypothetical protein